MRPRTQCGRTRLLRRLAEFQLVPFAHKFLKEAQELLLATFALLFRSLDGVEDWQGGPWIRCQLHGWTSLFVSFKHHFYRAYFALEVTVPAVQLAPNRVGDQISAEFEMHGKRQRAREIGKSKSKASGADGVQKREQMAC